jgi:hypothetical protein
MIRYRNRVFLRSVAWTAWTLIALAGCGGGGGGGGGDGGSNSTPVISNLQFSPAALLQFDGEGTSFVSGTIDFSDPGRDLASLTLVTQGQTLTTPIPGIAGMASGSLQGSLTVDTKTIGSYPFEVYASDAGGRRSNSLTGTFAIRQNDTGERWTVRSLPLPSGSTVTLRRVRRLASQFVAVGEGIFTSPDGITWTERQGGVAARLEDVAWKGGQFVAVGGEGTVLTSLDGAAWTRQVTPAATWPELWGIAASGDRLVAVGRQYLPVTGDHVSLILTSTDGVAWSEVLPRQSVSLNRVIWSGDRFVAVGSSSGEPMASAIALVSQDGLAWTRHAVGATSITVLYDLAWSGSQFVAVGYGGAALSTDGMTWQQVGAGSVTSSDAIGWSGQRFLACGVVYCQSSSDGVEWSSRQLPGTGASVRGLAWADTRWVAVGNASLVLTSP